MWKGMSENSQRRVSLLRLPQLVQLPVATNKAEQVEAAGAAIGREQRRLKRLLDAANASKDKLNELRRDLRLMKPAGLDSSELRNAFLDEVRKTVPAEQWRDMMNRAMASAAEKAARSDAVVIITVKKHRKVAETPNVGDERRAL